MYFMYLCKIRLGVDAGLVQGPNARCLHLDLGTKGIQEP